MDVFISHCEKDNEVAIALATALEQAGYSTWYYERDSLPGLSYVEQILEALEDSKALLLVVSAESVESDQVDMEVVEAHEASMPIFAVLYGMDHKAFKKRRRAWAAMLRAGVSANCLLPLWFSRSRRFRPRPGGDRRRHVPDGITRGRARPLRRRAAARGHADAALPAGLHPCAPVPVDPRQGGQPESLHRGR